MIKDDHIDISVSEENWGAEPSRVEDLLKEAAGCINKELDPSFTVKIKVIRGKRGCPYTPYGNNHPNKPYEIELTAGNRYWCWFAYQFAHEFCHVLSDLDKLRDSKNKWFHEAICELASSFVLRRMNSERWYPGQPKTFQDYEEKTRSNCINQIEKEYTPESAINLVGWLSEREKEIRNIPPAKHTKGDPLEKYRAIYALVAYTLLPIFEKYPFGWNAVRALPNSDSYIESYLDEWLQSVDKDNEKFFISRCQERMKSNITIEMLRSIK